MKAVEELQAENTGLKQQISKYSVQSIHWEHVREDGTAPPISFDEADQIAHLHYQDFIMENPKVIRKEATTGFLGNPWIVAMIYRGEIKSLHNMIDNGKMYITALVPGACGEIKDFKHYLGSLEGYGRTYHQIREGMNDLWEIGLEQRDSEEFHNASFFYNSLDKDTVQLKIDGMDKKKKKFFDQLKRGQRETDENPYEPSYCTRRGCNKKNIQSKYNEKTGITHMRCILHECWYDFNIFDVKWKLGRPPKRSA